MLQPPSPVAAALARCGAPPISTFKPDPSYWNGQSPKDPTSSIRNYADFSLSAAKECKWRGLHEDAALILNSSVAAVEGVYHPAEFVIDRSVQELADALVNSGQFDRAEPLLLRHIERLQENKRAAKRVCCSGPETSVSQLINYYGRLGYYEEAEKLLISELQVGTDFSTETRDRQLTLARIYTRMGRFSDARALLKRVKEGGQRGPETLVEGAAGVYGGEDPFIDVEEMKSFAREGRYEEAGAVGGAVLEREFSRLRTLLSQGDGFQQNFMRRELRSNGAVRAAVTAIEVSDFLLESGSLPVARNGFVAARDLQDQLLGGENGGDLYLRTLLGFADASSRLGDMGAARDAISRVEKHRSASPQAFDELDLRRFRVAIGHGLRSKADLPAAANYGSMLVTALEDRSSGTASSARKERERKDRASLYTLAADLTWSIQKPLRQGAGNPAADALITLQRASAGQSEVDVGKSLARASLGKRDPKLAEAITERDRLIAAIQAQSAEFAAGLTGGSTAEDSAGQARTVRLRALAAQLAALDDGLRRSFPEYFELIQAEPIAETAAKGLLAPDEAVLMLVPSPFGTHIMAVTRDGLAWKRSDWDQEKMAAAVRRVLYFAGANVTASPVDKMQWEAEVGEGGFDRKTAHDLYLQLVAPVTSAMAGKRHVYVAAAGSLSSLPLGILVKEPPQGSDSDPAALRSTRWFADEHALVQIPSLQALASLRRFSRQTGVNSASPFFMGFGDPALEGAAVQRSASRKVRGLSVASAFRPGVRRLVDTQELRKLSRLPGTAVELRAMAKAFSAPPSAVVLGNAATEKQVRSAELANVRVLALATHGVIAGELPGLAEPGLVFTPPVDPSEADDGYLSASEVATLRLNADWVILSACNTAAGDGTQGAPGLSGLARAFFYAGARSLLASHWPVLDEVTPVLTVRAVELARDNPGLSRAEALQRAMREVRENKTGDSRGETWAHPQAWAPFTLIGG
jgi:CHAT domain-containing protein